MRLCVCGGGGPARARAHPPSPAPRSLSFSLWRTRESALLRGVVRARLRDRVCSCVCVLGVARARASYPLPSPPPCVLPATPILSFFRKASVALAGRMVSPIRLPHGYPSVRPSPPLAGVDSDTAQLSILDDQGVSRAPS